MKPRAYWALVVVSSFGGCGAPDWRANVPAKYMEVAEIHHASCGGCHLRVEPGQRTRGELEKALSKHHSRVKMRDDQWVLLIDYLSRTP
jgi:hypothetical protein